MSFNLYSSGMNRFGPFTATAATITGPLITAPTASSVLVQLGGSKPNNIRYRGVQLMFAANTDNATGSFAIWARHNFVNAQQADISGNTIISLGTGAFTAGNIVSPAAATDFIADTLTFTASAFLTNLLTTLGAAAPLVHSPADNTPAVLRIEDLGNYDIYVDVWRAGASPATDVEVYVETNT